ncbi:Putative phosphatidylglycerol/phosphatidylinositol transfer protein DDB_G0282179 [Linum grandiflorum]
MAIASFSIQPANRSLFLLAAVCLLLPSALATKVEYCDSKANYAVKVDGIKITPNPVKAGKPATFAISANTAEAISGGQVLLEVYLWGLNVHSETRDLCEDSSCPIAVGDFVLSHSQSLPGFTPPGTYTLKMTLKNSKEQQLTCVSFEFSISWWLAADMVSDM